MISIVNGKNKNRMKQYNTGDKFRNITFLEEDFHEKEVTGYQRDRKAVFQCFCGRKFITNYKI